MTMTAKKKKILFWSVLMLAIILRCIRFGSVPDGINQDEAMGAMMHGHFQNTVLTVMARFCRFILKPGNTVR